MWVGEEERRERTEERGEGVRGDDGVARVGKEEEGKRKRMEGMIRWWW